ncbi:hypothetical protein H1C71_040738 [Ictidomys tridecemlineatus]|nr:hypothetical protein H1C71_040738 [Ictidomys tridecemlineatus]
MPPPVVLLGARMPDAPGSGMFLLGEPAVQCPRHLEAQWGGEVMHSLPTAGYRVISPCHTLAGNMRRGLLVTHSSSCASVHTLPPSRWMLLLAHIDLNYAQGPSPACAL